MCHAPVLGLIRTVTDRTSVCISAEQTLVVFEIFSLGIICSHVVKIQGAEHL